MEKDARYALFQQHQKFQIAVREHQRQARDAVNQMVWESSENYRVLMMQEFQGVQNRYQRRMEENERVSDTDGWILSTRSFTWSKKPYVTRTSSSSPRRKKRKIVREKARCARSYSHTLHVFDESYKTKKLNKSTFPKVSKLWNTSYKLKSS